MKRILLFLTLVFCIGLSAAAYEDKALGFRLTPPAGWGSEPVIAKRVGAVAAFQGPRQAPGFVANINIMVQPAPDLQAFNTLSVQQIQGAGKLISQRNVKLGGLPGRELIWKAVMEKQSMQFHTTFFTTRGKTYLFTGTSLESKWNSVAPAFRAAAATFAPAK